MKIYQRKTDGVLRYNWEEKCEGCKASSNRPRPAVVAHPSEGTHRDLLFALRMSGNGEPFVEITVERYRELLEAHKTLVERRAR